MQKFFLSLILFLLLFSVSSFSQLGSGGQPDEFLRYPVNSRATAMGGAFTSIVDDASALFWNPARLTKAQKLSFIGYINNIGYDTRHQYFGLSIKPFNNKYFNKMYLGFDWVALESGNFIQYNEMAIETGSFNLNKNAFSLGIGYKVTDKLALGYSYRKIGHEYSWQPKRSWNELHNLGMSFNTSLFFLKDLTYASVFKLGSNYSESVNSIASAFNNIREQDKILLVFNLGKVFCNNKYSYLEKTPWLFSTGVEYQFKPSIVEIDLRYGYDLNNEQHSIGIGICKEYKNYSNELDFSNLTWLNSSEIYGFHNSNGCFRFTIKEDSIRSSNLSQYENLYFDQINDMPRGNNSIIEWAENYYINYHQTGNTPEKEYPFIKLFNSKDIKPYHVVQLLQVLSCNGDSVLDKNLLNKLVSLIKVMESKSDSNKFLSEFKLAQYQFFIKLRDRDSSIDSLLKAAEDFLINEGEPLQKQFYYISACFNKPDNSEYVDTLRTIIYNKKNTERKYLPLHLIKLGNSKKACVINVMSMMDIIDYEKNYLQFITNKIN